MLEELFDFLNFLDRKCKKYPEEQCYTIEMDVDLYRKLSKGDLIPENGIFKFKNKTFVLG